MLRTWLVRLPARKLTFSVRSRHTPETPRTWAWPPSLPSVPTSRATRVTSSAKRRQLVDHRVDRGLELERLPLDVDGDLLAQVPLGHRRRHRGDVAHLRGQVPGHRVDRVGQVLPGPRDAGHVGLPAELALGADLAGDGGDLLGEDPQRVGQAVDRVRESGDLALRIHRDLLAQVIALGPHLP